MSFCLQQNSGLTLKPIKKTSPNFLRNSLVSFTKVGLFDFGLCELVASGFGNGHKFPSLLIVKPDKF